MISYQAAIHGHLEVKSIISKEQREEILAEVEDVVECELKKQTNNLYEFIALNFNSRIESGEIAATIKKHLHLISHFSFGLWYLDDSDEDLCIEQGKLDSCSIADVNDPEEYFKLGNDKYNE